MSACSGCTPALHRALGFSLLEVLVALLVLSIGLLGLAALQITSLELGTNSLFRTQATVAAYDILDRMRGNPTGFLANAYEIPNDTTFNTKIAAYTTCKVDTCHCETSACDPTNLALYDIGRWYELVKNTLPGAETRMPFIDRNGTTREVTITIRWVEKDSERTASWTAQL